MSPARFYVLTATGARLLLRVTPNAGTTRIDGVQTRADGETVLALRVSAVPDKGAANTAVIALLARALDMPRSALAITRGHTARLKTLTIIAAPSDLQARLEAL